MDNDSLTGSIKQLSADIGLLVRKELDLLRAELADKAKTAGVGAGMLSASAVTGLLTLGALTATAILLLALVLPAWLAALVVTIVWAVVTGALALSGKRKLQDMGTLVPEQTVANLKEDVEWARQGLDSAKK